MTGISVRNKLHSEHANTELEIEVSVAKVPASQGKNVLPTISKDRTVLLEWVSVSSFVLSLVVKKNPFVKALQRLMYGETNNNKPNEEKPEQMKQVLYGVNGCAQAGEMTALMGPSGSGKTTLLSILGNRAPKTMTYTGTVTYNGIPVNKAIRRLVGYVLQDDLLYPNLTVYETLYYAALLRLPKSMTKAEKLERVEAVILALGLDKCRHTLIGGEDRRGVSGGERKRVSIGHELLTNPSVLILDEPTSGLDSTIAMRLVSTLRVLADGGRVVLMTIHQPSSRIFQQLSRVILLSEGHVMYSGMAKDSAGWFEQQGFPIPAHINVADYLLDLANGGIEGNEMDGESSRLYLIGQMSGKMEFQSCSSINNNMEEEMDIAEYQLKLESSKKALLEASSKTEIWGATYIEQFCILLSRATKNRRFDSLTYFSVIRICSIAFLTSLFWWQIGSNNTLLAATDVSSALFFIQVQILFDLLLNALGTFPETYRLLRKERASGMYRLSAFYISESICTLPLDYSVPMIHLLIAYWSVHLHQSFFSYISVICVTILAALAVQAFGFLVGVITLNEKHASAYGVVGLIGMMLAAGFFVKGLPSWATWVQYLSIIYWSYRVSMQIQFHDRTYLDCGGISNDQLPLDQCSPIEDLGNELNVPFDLDGEKWPSIITLFLMFLILRVATYYVLRVRTKA
eukprot:g9216.t1